MYGTKCTAGFWRTEYVNSCCLEFRIEILSRKLMTIIRHFRKYYCIYLLKRNFFCDGNIEVIILFGSRITKKKQWALVIKWNPTNSFGAHSFPETSKRKLFIQLIFCQVGNIIKQNIYGKVTKILIYKKYFWRFHFC